MLEDFIEYMQNEKKSIIRLWILLSLILVSFVILSYMAFGAVVYSNEKDSQAATNNQPATAPVGRWFTVKNSSDTCTNISITKAFKFSLATPTRCFLADSSFNILNYSTVFIGDNCTLEYPLVYGQKYYVAFDGSGSQYTDYYFNSPGFFPKNYTYTINVIQSNANTYPPSSSVNTTDYEETITGIQIACDLKASNKTMEINTSLVNNSNIFDRTNETVLFNGVLSGITNDLANCSFYVSNVLNLSRQVNLSMQDSFSYDYGFFLGNRTFRINCSNPEATGDSGYFQYTVDTTRIIIYRKTQEIANLLSPFIISINEVVNMLVIILIYIAFLSVGYDMVRTKNYVSGLTLIGLTLFIDLYFISYFYGFFGINPSTLLALDSWEKFIKEAAFLGILLFPIAKVFILLNLSHVQIKKEL